SSSDSTLYLWNAFTKECLCTTRLPSRILQIISSVYSQHVAVLTETEIYCLLRGNRKLDALQRISLPPFKPDAIRSLYICGDTLIGEKDGSLYKMTLAANTSFSWKYFSDAKGVINIVELSLNIFALFLSNGHISLWKSSFGSPVLTLHVPSLSTFTAS